jgi:hypothetical protein
MTKRILSFTLCFLFPLCLFSVSHADNADVLPKGVFGVNSSSYFYLPIKKQFDTGGHTQDLAVDYNATLDSYIFAPLGMVEAAFGMPPGSANVGTSIVDFEYHIKKEEILLAYGLTDKVTVGIMIPYLWQKNEVKAKLNTSKATVGKSVALNTLAPLGFMDTVPLTKNDVLDLLGKGMDINGDGTVDTPGYGYKKFDTWSNDAIGDIEAGVKYQYFKSENWRLAFTGGMRFPTGEADDPDNLVDLGFGYSLYTLLFRSQNDYTGIQNVLLNATLIYEVALPDSQSKRVPDDVNRPITTNKENVDRDVGDLIEFKLLGVYSFAKGFSFSAMYDFQYGFSDQVDGDRDYLYESLEDETDFKSHECILGISYSTLPLFMEKKFSVPLVASLSYRNRFAGANLTKSQYINFGLQLYF